MKIGIFDSGIGGLSVLPAIRRALPRADLLYYADEENVPYGERSPEQILDFSLKAVHMLISEGASAVVIACNTATSVAVATLRYAFEAPEVNVPIIGMEPAVKRALDFCPGGRVLAAATPVTVKGKKLKLLIEKYDKNRLTDTVALPGLVKLAERGAFGTAEADEYIKNELSRFDLSKYSALVLGCTHFNYFKDSFRRILPESVRIVDGVDGTVRRLVSRLPEGIGNGAGEGSVTFFSSGKMVNRLVHPIDPLDLIKRLEEMESIE